MLRHAFGANDSDGFGGPGQDSDLEHSVSVANEAAAVGVADLECGSGHGW
jgi:hypothetical protein